MAENGTLVATLHWFYIRARIPGSIRY